MREAPVAPGLWLFDFDGTLAEVVPDRTAARLHPACRSMLSELAAGSARRVAVISSRRLDDLIPRVPLPGIYLGGGSGIEWRAPGGERLVPGGEADLRRDAMRRLALPLLEEAGAIPGVDLEDKGWSAAVHFRDASKASRLALSAVLDRLGVLPGLRMYRGPQSVEIPFIAEADKSYGVRRICRLLGLPDGTAIFFAGDDDNDAAAMRWILDGKGIAVAVGGRIALPGAMAVEGPAILARVVRRLARLAEESDGAGSKKKGEP